MVRNKMALAVMVMALGLCAAAQYGPLVIQAHTPARIFAQKLVNDTLAKHPEVVIMAMHVTPPGKKDNVIIASNIGRMGKKADEDDMRVINTGKSNLEVNKAGNHFEVEAALKDKAGKIIGCTGIVFNYKEGDDKEKLEKQANEINSEMEAQIPTRKKLFEKIK